MAHIQSTYIKIIVCLAFLLPSVLWGQTGTQPRQIEAVDTISTGDELPSYEDYIMVSELDTIGIDDYRYHHNRLAIPHLFEKGDSVCFQLVVGGDTFCVKLDTLQSADSDSYAFSGLYADDTLTIYRTDGSSTIDSFKVEIIGGSGTDDQTLSILGHDLSIEDGNTVALPDTVDPDTDVDSLGLIGKVLHVYEDEKDQFIDLSSINSDTQKIFLSMAEPYIWITDSDSIELTLPWVYAVDSTHAQLGGPTNELLGGIFREGWVMIGENDRRNGALLTVSTPQSDFNTAIATFHEDSVDSSPFIRIENDTMKWDIGNTDFSHRFQIEGETRDSSRVFFEIDTSGQIIFTAYRDSFIYDPNIDVTSRPLIVGSSGRVWKTTYQALADSLSIAVSADSVGTVHNADEILYSIGGRGAGSTTGFEFNPSNNDFKAPGDTYLANEESAILGTAEVHIGYDRTQDGDANLSLHADQDNSADLELIAGGNVQIINNTAGTFTLRSTGAGIFLHSGSHQNLINTTGQWQWPAYTAAGSFPITETAILGINSSGNVGTIDPSSIGTSPFTDQGTYITQTDLTDDIHINGAFAPGYDFRVSGTSAFVGHAQMFDTLRLHGVLLDYIGNPGTTGQVLQSWESGTRRSRWADLAAGPGFTVTAGGGIFTFTPDDQSATNELQTLSFNSGTNDLTISSGNTVGIGDAGYWQLSGSFVRLKNLAHDVNVGGSSTPGKQLYVSGDFEVTGGSTLRGTTIIADGLADKDVQLGTNGQYLASTGTEADWRTLPDASSSNELQNLGIGTRTSTTYPITISSGSGTSLGLFTSTQAGLARGSGGGTTNFLRADGTWAVPSGSSDGDGIYDGSGTVPASTKATVSTTFEIATGTGSDQFIVDWGDNGIGNLNIRDEATDLNADGSGSVKIGNTTNVDDQLEIDATGSYVQMGHEIQDVNYFLRFQDNSDIRMDANDFVLNVDNSLIINGGTTSTYDLEVGGIQSSTSATTFTLVSDSTIKENIREITDSYRVMRDLRPVTYFYKEAFRNSISQVKKERRGFIAQEYQKIFPEDVNVGELLAINHDAIGPYTVAAVKQLIKDKEALEKRIEALEAQLIEPAGLSTPIDKEGFKINIEIEKK